MGERMRPIAPTGRRSPPRPIWRTLWRERRGAVAILIALAMPILIGFAGLGVETGLWYAVKVQNQSATDNAALSAAMEVNAGKTCADYSSLATYAAGQNGFTPTSTTFPCPVSGANCTTGASYICVNSPPTSGSLSGNSQAVEVTISQQQSALLAALYLPSVTIQTRSVASVGSDNKACVVALNSGATASAVNVAGGTVSLSDCWVAANSTSTTSIATTGAGVLCVYNISTGAASGPTTTTVADCTSPAAGINVIHTPPLTSNPVTVSSVTLPTLPSAETFGIAAVIKTTTAATPTGTCTANLNTTPAACVLHFPNPSGSTTGIVAGMPVADLNETTSTAKIPDGTTTLTKICDSADATFGCTAARKGDVGLSNPIVDDGVTCPSPGGTGVCKNDNIVFTTSTSLQPGHMYTAPVGLVSGTYALSAGVYYIYGEGGSAHGYARKGVSLNGVAFYAGSKATITTASDGVTFVLVGDGSSSSGAIDINCSFPFTTGSMALTATSVANGGIPAGLLFYQQPTFADTTTAPTSTTACPTSHNGKVRNAITFGAGVTLSGDSRIYTPATQFDFSGTTSNLCVLLQADTITFGLNTAVTTNLSYPRSSCVHVTPPLVSTSTSLAE